MTEAGIPHHITPALEAFASRSGGKADGLTGAGIPTRRVEAWRYTPLRRVADVRWAAAPEMAAPDVERCLGRVSLPQDGARAVFANGHAVPSLSTLPEGLEADHAGLVDPLEDRFSARLNAALSQDGLSLHVPAGVDAGRITLVSLHQGDGISTHLRHRIVLDEGASLTLFDVCAGEGGYLANPRFDIVLAPGSRLRHVKHQAEDAGAVHLGIVCAALESHAEYNSFTLNVGSAVARHEVVATLQAAHALVHVHGIQIVDGDRLNDLTSMIHHAAPDCNSWQTVKTVLSDTAQGVFQGKILVDRIAQKTDGYQMNQALLLSEKAQMNSKPELEIYADDVRCSHGATVGALDDEQLFYLRSRGVPEAAARYMLVRAFLTDALELVEDEVLRALLLEQIAA